MKCQICGSTDFRTLFNVNSFDIFQCQSCQLIFIDPDVPKGLEEQFLNKIYKSDYFEKKKDSNAPGYSENYIIAKKAEVVFNAKRRLKKIEKSHPGKGTMLEIGCAAGFFLDVARHQGWNVTGVEISPEIAEFGRNELNLDIKTGRFETLDLPENSYDIIVAWDVIEHVLNPVNFIIKARRLLNHDGFLVLGTPNVGSLAYFLRRNQWVHLRPPEHVFYYSSGTLNRLLLKFFEVVEVMTVMPPFSKPKHALKAYLKFFLYKGFNTIARLIGLDEYLFAVASKKRE